MEINKFYSEYKNTPIIYMVLILIGILIKVIFDIIIFGGALLNFIFNYDFDSALFRKIPTINLIYLIFSIIILILSVRYMYEKKKKILLFSGLFIVTASIISRFIIAGVAISVINLYANLEIPVREDMYIFLPPTIYLLVISLIILVISVFYFCKEKISIFSIVVILNLVFSVFSNIFFNILLSRADSCIWFFNEMNDIYNTRGQEMDCPIFITLYLQKIYPLINLGFYLIIIILIYKYLKKNNVNLLSKKEN